MNGQVLAAVGRELAVARSGNARVVIVRGARGVGKSSVLRRVSVAEKYRGGTVLHAAGMGDAAALAVARRLLSPAGISVPEADISSPQSLFALFLALSRQVIELSEDRSLCLVVDDVDACDPVTVHWLGFLVRRVAGRPFALLLARGTERVEPKMAEALAGLAALSCCSVVDIRALDRQAIAELVRNALGTAADPGLVDLCLQLSGGTPRHLNMLLAGMRPRAADLCPSLNDLTRAAVVAVVSARLREKPGQIAFVAAVEVLDSIDPDLIGPLIGVAPHLAEKEITALGREHLLGRDLPRPAREWFGQAVLDVLGADRVDALRARAAFVLSDHGRPVEDVARLLVLLDRPDEPWMAQVLAEAAGLGSARGAPETAARCLSRLVELEPDDVELRLHLATELSRSDPGAAARRFRAVFHSTDDPALRARAATGLATVAGDVADIDGVAEVLSAAQRELESSLGGDRWAMLTAARLAYELSRVGTARSAVVRARAMTPPPGETAAQRCLLGVLAEAIMRGGGPLETALDCARRALADVHTSPDRSAISAACVLRAAGETAEALAVLDRVVRAFTAAGDEPARCRALTQRAVVHMSLGDLASARQDVEEAVRIVHARLSPHDMPRPMILLAWIHLQQGEPAEAEHLLTSVDPAGRVLEVREFLRASAWACEEEKQTAWLVAKCRQAMAETGLPDPTAAAIWADLAQLSAMAGHRLNATAAAEQAELLARTWRAGETAAFAQLARGAVPTEPGTEPGEVDRITEACAAFAAVPALVHQARAETMLGKHLLRRGDDRGARTHLRTAVGLALRCGHQPLMAEARELLRDAGGRMRIPARRTVADLTGLTSSERRVAYLAAGGVSNREIALCLTVAVRTVELHLTNAYRKLGITGRAELPGVLAPASGD